MANARSKPLSDLLSEASTISKDTFSSFGNLTAEQLNWKPNAHHWSVAQCFDHLLIANATYFPSFENVLSGKKKNTFWESLPFLPSLWGSLVIKAVAPETTRKRKNPKIFNPSGSSVDEDIIRRFVDQQSDIVRYMKATENMDLEKVTISSPVSNLITYSLMDAYRIIVAHEKRHVLQAMRVLEMAGFPT
jgi:DinB superfamily